MTRVQRNTKGCLAPHAWIALAGVLGLLLFLPIAPAYSGTVDLPQTGQTSCYNQTGVLISSCSGTGQDGDTLAGVPWPEPRFSSYLFACIVDNLTGLMWVANPAALSSSPTSWEASVINAASMYNLCGFADWRLPNINELQSLINDEEQNNALWLFEQGFTFPLSGDLTYWSSTSWAEDPSNAWIVDMISGNVEPDAKNASHYGWPVRKYKDPVAELWKTGQTITYSDYDDGATQRGETWPNPRFTASGDCVTDNLTSLMWSKDANLDGLKTWANAIVFTQDVTICGYADWRLPNAKELFSLIDRSRSGPALQSGHPFTNVQSASNNLYWSSTTYSADTTEAWAIDMLFGGLNAHLKTQTAFVWPVRGGQTRPYVLTVKKEGDGKGKVSAPGLTCEGKTCTGDYASYEVITVTATASSGSVFAGWEDCPAPSGNTCMVTITEDTTIIANFIPEYKISVSPRSLNFKNLKLGIPSPAQTVTVTNGGASPLQISSITIVDDDPVDDVAVFSPPTNDCPAELTNLGDYCTITIIATSDNYETRKAKMQISSNDPKKPITVVRLKAKAKPPKIARKPRSLNFGTVALGSSFEKTLILSNKGVTDLQIPSGGTISIMGDAGFMFAPSSCPDLATGETCELTVTFTPGATPGQHVAVLSIPSNDPKRPILTINLKGTGE